jgi:hypothetical protein
MPPSQPVSNRMGQELDESGSSPISPSLLHPINPKPQLTQTLNIASSHLYIRLSTSMLDK